MSKLKSLKQIRNEFGVTQDELAKSIGTTNISVHKWESGKALPNIYNLYHMAKMFDLELDYLAQVCIVGRRKYKESQEEE